jgi:putative ABC transport system permease protein
MNLWNRLRFWLTRDKRRYDSEREMDTELHHYLESYTEDLVHSGLPREEAQRQARLQLGHLDSLKEDCRDARGPRILESLLQDLRYSFRTLRKSAGSTTVTILTLALAIGANTAIFSVVNVVLLRPLPYAAPNHLVLVREVIANFSPDPITVSAPDIGTIHKLSHVFEDVVGFNGFAMDLSGSERPERVQTSRVGAGLFSLLGVQPIAGRNFTPEEDHPGQNVAILSYALWQQRFGGRDVVGQTVDLDRQPYTIVGVMPKSFIFPLPGMSAGEPGDLWIPLALTKDELTDIGDNFNFGVLARLKPGIDLRKANADLALVGPGVLDTYPKEGLGDLRLSVVAQPLNDQVTGPLRLMLTLLLGAVGFVLLIACANVANLVLVRAAARQRDLAVRVALGARRSRLIQQSVVEGLLLSFAGGALGLLVSYSFKAALVAGLPPSVPLPHAVELDLRVMLFTFALTLLAGLAFGLLPALSVSRSYSTESLKDGERGATPGTEHLRLRSTLVVAEVALSMTLLVGAGLLLRSFAHVLDTKPGFEPTHVLTADINLPAAQYPQPAMVYAFYRQLLERLRQTPGVTAAGTSTDLPTLGGWSHRFAQEGERPEPGGAFKICYHSVISGEYLQAMGIPLLRGRYFNDQDRADTTHVLIVSETMAKRYWPREDALGKRLKWGSLASSDPWLTIVGIVGDVKQGPLDAETLPHTYEPYAQLSAIPSLNVAVQSNGNPAALSAGFQAAVWGLDRQIAVHHLRTMDQVISRSTAARRFNLVLLGAFAATALLLAAIGIYGVLAYSVSRRTHEIGIRMALGAESSSVLYMVLKQGLGLSLAGVAIGLVGSIFVTKITKSMLYEVTPSDPATFLCVTGILIGVAMLACYIPARRAMRLDPLAALRHE